MSMKQIRLRIIDLIDQHGDTFEKCKDCPLCKEIMQLRKKLERDPADKYQYILAKGQDMTKSDIAFLLEKDVQVKTIRSAAGIPQLDFYNMMVNYGFTKPRRKEDMAKLDMTVDEFIDLKYVQKLPITKIAELKGVSDPSIHHWRNQRKEQIKSALRALNLPDGEVKKEIEHKHPSKENEAKSAENERLIVELRNDLNKLNNQLDEKDKQIRALNYQKDCIKKELADKNGYILELQIKVQDLEAIHAACEDVENEISSLREDNKNLAFGITKLGDENNNLDLENQAMRQLLKLWI